MTKNHFKEEARAKARAYGMLDDAMTNSTLNTGKAREILEDYAVVLTRYTVEKAFATRHIPKKQFEGVVDRQTEKTLNDLLELILEIIGRQSPYKDGNWSYWAGQKDLRTELRQAFRKAFGGNEK